MNDEKQAIVSCKGVFKTYKGSVKVFEDFDIDIPRGKIVGLLGPNGCGKSTLIKLIVGLLPADRGEITVDGEPRSERSNAVISYLPERTYFDSRMSVSELFSFFEDFYSDFSIERARKLIADLGIDENARLKTLSKGTKEKVQLIMVMSRKAKLYILDEPIAGVDPAARDYILKTIISDYDQDSTILITTHLIYDIEPVLDEFFFLGKGGEIKLCGSCDEVREREGRSLDELFREVFRC